MNSMNSYEFYVNIIGFLFMLVLTESYSQKLECKSIVEALNYKITPILFRRFADDSHARFKRGHTHIPFWKYRIN